MTVFWEPPAEHPYDALQRLNAEVFRLKQGMAELMRERADMLNNWAGLCHNHINLKEAYDELDNRLNVLEAIFIDKR